VRLFFQELRDCAGFAERTRCDAFSVVSLISKKCAYVSRVHCCATGDYSAHVTTIIHDPYTTIIYMYMHVYIYIYIYI